MGQDRKEGGCSAGKAVGNSNQVALHGLGKPHYALGRPKGLQGLAGAQAVHGGSSCGFAPGCSDHCRQSQVPSCSWKVCRSRSETIEGPWTGPTNPSSQPKVNISSRFLWQRCPRAELCSCDTACAAHTLPQTSLPPAPRLCCPFTLFRSLPGTAVASIQAMHTGGSSGRITYSIVSGNEKNAFLIQPSSGTAPRPPGEAVSGRAPVPAQLSQGSQSPKRGTATVGWNTVHTSIPVS